MDTALALVDCQNFYVSCERVFDPSLRGRPVAVLSNNDGCVIARSEEVKAAGVEMGAPYFKAKGLLRHIGATVYSSNYALYGDMSRRVRAVLERCAVELEAYSIDECFLTLPRMERARLREVGRRIRRKVGRLVGVPVRVGIGRTKTLAKLASCRAKEDLRAGRGEGVFVEPEGKDERATFLRNAKAGEVWGIGPAYEGALAQGGVTDALGVACLPAEWARRHLTVRGLRTSRELRGERCLPLELAPPPKKSVTRSRSFPKPETELRVLQEAVAAHAERAAEKLREAGLVARGIRVFARTKAFGPGPRYSNAAGGTLPGPATSYSLRLARAARRGTRSVWRSGVPFRKAGVTLYELRPEKPGQPTLFSGRPDPREQALMAAVDQVNGRMGRRTVRIASTGARKRPKWRMKRSRLSPRYTTRWDEVPLAFTTVHTGERGERRPAREAALFRPASDEKRNRPREGACFFPMSAVAVSCAGRAARARGRARRDPSSGTRSTCRWRRSGCPCARARSFRR